MWHKNILLLTVTLATVLLHCSARPRKFYLTTEGNSLRRFLKSLSANSNELFCPRNIEGSEVIVKGSKLNKCTEEYDLCHDSSECEPGLMCCPSGCIYKCVVPQRPAIPIATDWIDEPEALTVGGSPWLISGDGKDTSPAIDCSTSVFPGIEPTRCPTGFMCIIKIEEDTPKQIPNRGICLQKAWSESNIVEEFMNLPLPEPEAPCYFHGKRVPHGYHDTIDCNSCFCKDGEMYCQVYPC